MEEADKTLTKWLIHGAFGIFDPFVAIESSTKKSWVSPWILPINIEQTNFPSKIEVLTYIDPYKLSQYHIIYLYLSIG